jgi:hypothetical protein
MGRLDNLHQHAMDCAADVALWPAWKRNHPSPAPSEVPNREILRAAIRRLGALISDLQERQREYPFRELEDTIEDLHQALVKVEEEYLPVCGVTPLERLAGAADDD